MGIITLVVAGLIGLLHVYIFVLEAFLWDKPMGLKAFGLQPDFARASRVLAANQGVYNAFLAAGLALALVVGSGTFVAFFLGCVFVAGLVGGFTSSPKIFFIQTVPAGLGLGALFLGW